MGAADICQLSCHRALDQWGTRVTKLGSGVWTNQGPDVTWTVTNEHRSGELRSLSSPAPVSRILSVTRGGETQWPEQVSSGARQSISIIQLETRAREEFLSSISLIQSCLRPGIRGLLTLEEAASARNKKMTQEAAH